MEDLCILLIIVLKPSLASAFFYCSGLKPGLRILSPGFSEQSATDSFSTPFIRSEFLSFFLSEICSKADTDLNRKVFLGPRGPLVLPLVDPPAPARAMKIWTPIYRHICLMNHQETPQTNPMAQWDPLDVSLNPLGPPGPPSPPWDP